MNENVKESAVELLRYDFKGDELTGIAKTIAAKFKEAEDLEMEKKSVVADYASQEKKLGLQIRDLSRQITQGYEMRRQPCLMFKDFETGMVYYFVADQFREYEIDTLVEAYETMDELIHRLDEVEIYPVKRRSIREDERQRGVFDDQEEGQGDQPDPADETVVDIDGQIDDTEADAHGDDVMDAEVDAEFDAPEKRGDDKDLQRRLRKVLEKRPTLKTIAGFTDDEWMETWLWADRKYLSKSLSEIAVPEKPEFIGPAK